jgi:hypothetical protein
MKRIYLCLVLLLSTAPVLQAQAPAMQSTPPPPTQPIYIYLYARITDQVNLDITEARLRRVLPMIERYRKEHPEAHVNATIFFSGASSRALDESNAKTHIKDFVLDYKKRGVIEVGYDGTDEPTYANRPVAELADANTPEARWLARAAADDKFLTEARDPLTGAPLPGSVGGLREMQRVFGEASCVAGVNVGFATSTAAGRAVSEAPGVPKPRGTTADPGVTAAAGVSLDYGNWESVAVTRRYNANALMFGLPATNIAHIPGFGGSIAGVGSLLSPVGSNSSYELNWENYALQLAESGGSSVRVIHGNEGVQPLKDFFAKINKFRIRIIHMEIGSEGDYLKADFAKATYSPSLTYAYAHPDNPKVPADARLSDDEVNAMYTKEDAALTWLTTDLFPANAGSRFVSSTDLESMTPPTTGYSISVAALSAALKDALEKWGVGTFPPNFFEADGHYLSLAETFQVLTDTFAEFDRTGKLPQFVRVTKVYGPVGVPAGHGPNEGEVSVASIAKTCTKLEAQLHDESKGPMPKNVIPPGVQIDGVGINSAQFLRLMAHALLSPTPETKLSIRMTYMIPPVGQVYPKTRSMEDIGAIWTFKPAPLESHGAAQATHAELLPQPSHHPGAL